MGRDVLYWTNLSSMFRFQHGINGIIPCTTKPIVTYQRFFFIVLLHRDRFSDGINDADCS